MLGSDAAMDLRNLLCVDRMHPFLEDLYNGKIGQASKAKGNHITFQRWVESDEAQRLASVIVKQDPTGLHVRCT